ncbi:hypothetical protein [Actinoplanes sp. NPDC051411]|uniref:hypothetical protein n=1 Tax=Actinoplanes sp. NPDC051411 TaxID=3155522 RepID=UPI00342A8CF5
MTVTTSTHLPPTLLNSCAWAATAREAAYRIDKPPAYVRTSRVFALDPGAAGVVRDVAALPWHDTRFITSFDAGTLDDELRDADFAMMIATADDGAAAAYSIGHACWERGITTAGIVLDLGGLGPRQGATEAVNALRPHARVLLVTRDRQDIVEILGEVGA